MKKTFFVIIVIALSGCNRSAESSNNTNDTTVVDTLSKATSVAQDTITADALAARYASVSEQFNSASFPYEVTIETSEYEAMSTVLWKFDSAFSVRYYKEDWAFEGQEGNSEYFLENGNVVCTEEEESVGGAGSAVKRACNGSRGIILTWNEGQEQPDKNFLPDDYLITKQRDNDQAYQTLLSLLKQNEITEKTEQIYTIKIENIINAGEDFKELTEIIIPKTLYEALIN